MRTIELDIRQIHTVRALHIYLRYRLRLAPHYGGNLDALYDALSAESEPTRIVLRVDGQMSGEMATYLPRLCAVLADAARANPRLAFAMG